MPTRPPQYRRILLKCSGEALMGADTYGIDFDSVARIADEVKQDYPDPLRMISIR